jgi:hypothetical protein
LFINAGEHVQNDHIAFRTFDVPRVNIDVLEKVFTTRGYARKDSYYFPEKKLNARHYEHTTDDEAPRIFISELICSEFSNYLREQISEIINKIPAQQPDCEKLIFSGTAWGDISYKVYENLRKESEYAAWLYYSGFRVNHFTVSVNNLKHFDTIQKVNSFIKDNGFKLNDSGGEIKGSSGSLLEQSSTKAGLIKVQFNEGIFEVPGCYYEFAKRYPDSNGNLFSGFIAKSANQIFESTDNK